ncbi:MAG: N-acetylneuraminate synthase [Cyanobacteria bacterium TGS_CYA1]|nr:N-acetylneuraminate synthase [Cyanobacteria bacterium TGS_CYA1]
MHNDPQRVLIIAEAGVNHNGSLKRAIEMVKVAKESGADVVKFQSFSADSITTRTNQMADYQKRNTKSDTAQWAMLKQLELSEDDHFTLFECCKKEGIEFVSSPFDVYFVQFLKNLGVTKYKIPSGEITNGPLLLAIANTGIPAILSTGMSTLEEVTRALKVLSHGYLCKSSIPTDFSDSITLAETEILKEYVSLLHCTSEYPVEPHKANLRAIEKLKKTFGLTTGFSDHTQGVMISIAAVSLGAQIIEKHFTLDKTLPGPDHRASLDPLELQLLVSSIRNVENAMGTGDKIPTEDELKVSKVARKVLVASKKIAIGESFSESNLTVKRGGNGISPMDYWSLLGKKSSRAYDLDDVLLEDLQFKSS